MRLDGGISLNSADREMIDFIRDGLALSLPLATDTFMVRTALSWLAREIRQKHPVDLPALPVDPAREAIDATLAKLSPDVDERMCAQLREIAAKFPDMAKNSVRTVRRTKRAGRGR